MRHRRRWWRWAGTLLCAASITACAPRGGPDGAGLGPARAPADPLYRHTIPAPRGREWEFQIGGGYVSDR